MDIFQFLMNVDETDHKFRLNVTFRNLDVILSIQSFYPKNHLKLDIFTSYHEAPKSRVFFKDFDITFKKANDVLLHPSQLNSVYTDAFFTALLKDLEGYGFTNDCMIGNNIPDNIVQVLLDCLSSLDTNYNLFQTQIQATKSNMANVFTELKQRKRQSEELAELFWAQGERTFDENLKIGYSLV